MTPSLQKNLRFKGSWCFLHLCDVSFIKSVRVYIWTLSFRKHVYYRVKSLWQWTLQTFRNRRYADDTLLSVWFRFRLFTRAVRWRSGEKCTSSRISSCVSRPPSPASPRPICPEETTNWLWMTNETPSVLLDTQFISKSNENRSRWWAGFNRPISSLLEPF